MLSRKVVIDGVTYVRSRDAARSVNLALDYISRLARTGDFHALARDIAPGI